MGPRWPWHYLCQFEKSLPTSRNPLQSCLMFHSILDLLQKTYCLANFNSSYDIIGPAGISPTKRNAEEALD